MASNLNFFARFFALSRRKQLVVLIVLALTLFIGVRVYQALTKTSRSKTAETTVVQIKRSEITQLQAVSLDKTLPISGSLDALLGHLFLVAHALGIDAVVVLADGHVQGPVNLGAVHVELHLHPVLGLGLLDPVLLQVVKGLLAVRLELGHVALLGRFRHA